jgi:hypothetical protein
VADNDRWVVEYPEGGWAVEREDRERVSDILGGGELIVKGRDGQIRLKDTVAGS